MKKKLKMDIATCCQRKSREFKRKPPPDAKRWWNGDLKRRKKELKKELNRLRALSYRYCAFADHFSHEELRYWSTHHHLTPYKILHKRSSFIFRRNKINLRLTILYSAKRSDMIGYDYARTTRESEHYFHRKQLRV